MKIEIDTSEILRRMAKRRWYMWDDMAEKIGRDVLWMMIDGKELEHESFPTPHGPSVNQVRTIEEKTTNGNG